MDEVDERIQNNMNQIRNFLTLNIFLCLLNLNIVKKKENKFSRFLSFEQATSHMTQ